MSSVFSRKITMFTFSGCLTGEGTPLKYCTGRKQTKRSSSCRSATLSERIPPPTGVVNGPLIPIRYSRNASTVSSGSHSSNLSFAVCPANTSNHAIFFFPVYAFSTAASNTRTLAAQISGPVPSPRMNGMIGRSGTFNLSVLVIFSPAGGATSLYGIGRNCSGSRVCCNLAEVVRNQAPRRDYVRLYPLIRWLTLRSRNFLAFIFFKIFSIFRVTPNWPHPCRRSSNPVCKIRTRHHRSGYKRVNLARGVTNKKRIERLHKLV